MKSHRTLHNDHLRRAHNYRSATRASYLIIFADLYGTTSHQLLQIMLGLGKAVRRGIVAGDLRLKRCPLQTIAQVAIDRENAHVKLLLPELLGELDRECGFSRSAWPADTNYNLIAGTARSRQPRDHSLFYIRHCQT